ncbi:MAG: Sec-independent protein translocase protein TatB [Amphiplicatus sp.]
MNLVPQFGFFELVMVAIVALVVVGPKELPRLMRMAGKMFAQARRMAAEFTSAFDQMARESEMEEMRKEIAALKDNNPLADAKREVDAAMRPVENMVRAEAGELRDAVTKPVGPVPDPNAPAADKPASEKTDPEPAQTGGKAP